MKDILSKIKGLSKSLPNRDIKLAESYINSREFDKLLEIVDSDIYLVQKHRDSDDPNDKYRDIKIEDLIVLKSIVEEYLSYQDISNYNNYDIIYDETVE